GSPTARPASARAIAGDSRNLPNGEGEADSPYGFPWFRMSGTGRLRDAWANSNPEETRGVVRSTRCTMHLRPSLAWSSRGLSETRVGTLGTLTKTTAACDAAASNEANCPSTKAEPWQ